MSKRSLILGSALFLLLAGSFVGGYFLMQPPEAAPTPAPTVAPATQDAPAETGPRFVVTKAVYGDLPDGPSTDVTEKVAAAFDGTHLSLPVSNDTFGSDPAFGIVKKVRVDYIADGKPMTRTVAEGETLLIAPFDKPIALVVIKAVYGEWPNGASADVTKTVQEAFDGHKLSITASNDTFGNDPAPNIPKKLRVLYTLDGREKYKIVDEGEKVELPEGG